MWENFWYFEIDNGNVHVEYIELDLYLKYLRKPLMKLVGRDLRRLTKKRIVVDDGFIDIHSFNYKKKKA